MGRAIMDAVAYLVKAKGDEAKTALGMLTAPEVTDCINVVREGNSTPPPANAPQDTTAKGEDIREAIEAGLEASEIVESNETYSQIAGNILKELEPILARHAPDSTEDSRMLDWLEKWHPDFRVFRTEDGGVTIKNGNGWSFSGSNIRAAIRAAMLNHK